MDDRPVEQDKWENQHAYDKEILAEQVKQLYSLAPIGMLATLLNSSIVFFILQDVTSYRWLTVWLAVIFAITAIRAALVLHFRRMALKVQEARRWGNLFIVGLAAIGVAWGSLGAFPLIAHSLPYEVFLAFVLGGMAAGGAATYSACRGAYLAFAFPALLPLTIHFLLVENLIGWAMGGMLAFFGILLWRLSRHTFRINRTSLVLRFENREIIGSLQNAKERVEGLNRTLLTEINAKRRVEAELRSHRNHLEKTIQERTNELLQANEQLQAARDAAEGASLAKSEFLANMSHELRTPLTVILGSLEFLQKAWTAPERDQLLEITLTSAQRLLEIIDDLLDIAKIEARQLRIEEQTFDLRGCVRHVVKMFAPSAREKGLRLSWSVDSQVPNLLRGDASRLGQVLINLVGNAMKFTKAGEVEVRVKAEKEDLVFSVRDTGIGIPEEKIDLLFQAFMQVDTSLTRPFGGTGLGLAISKELVKMMGGAITVESAIGIGSTFIFTIPLRLAEISQQPATPEMSVEDSVPPLHVLLAEDDRMVRDLIRIILQNRGFSVTVAENGHEAVARFQDGGIDLVLMDLQMPEMNGLEATKKIRELENGDRRKICIFALTAHVLPENRQGCLEAGMDGFLSKPLDIEELYKLIKACPCGARAMTAGH